MSEMHTYCGNVVSFQINMIPITKSASTLVNYVQSVVPPPLPASSEGERPKPTPLTVKAGRDWRCPPPPPPPPPTLPAPIEETDAGREGMRRLEGRRIAPSIPPTPPSAANNCCSRNEWAPPPIGPEAERKVAPPPPAPPTCGTEEGRKKRPSLNCCCCCCCWGGENEAERGPDPPDTCSGGEKAFRR